MIYVLSARSYQASFANRYSGLSTT